MVVITGPNGSGKTNLLEAISLLLPGRGLRGARLSEVAHRGSPETGPGPMPWAVAGRLTTADGDLRIGTGVVVGAPERRAFLLDGQPARAQAAVAERIAAIWLTPPMDRLLTEGAGGRRRFLDRLAYALDPGHARLVAAHDHAVAERNRLLARGAEAGWLSAAEDQIARYAVAVTAARAGLVAGLNTAFAAGAVAPFPAARLSLPDPVAMWLASRPAVEVEDAVRSALAGDRARDAAAGGTRMGAHRADLEVADLITGRPAARASTGQQKALLIGLVLAQAGLIAAARGFAPLLLLDEPVVHLDATHRAALFEALASGAAQAFVTGTDAEPFAPLAKRAAFWVIEDGKPVSLDTAG